MRTTSTLLLVLIVLAVLAPSASAQFCLGDPIACAQEDARSIVRNSSLGSLREQAISRAIYGSRRYGYQGGYYGASYGYPSVGGGRIGRDVGAGLLGAALGGTFGGRKGALVGVAAGVGIAELGGYYADRRNRPLDCGKRKLSRDEREACMALAQQAEAERRVAAATRWLFNRSGQQAIVTDGGQPLCNNDGHCFMRPGENWQVDRPASGQYAVILEVPKGPGMTQLPGEVRSTGSQGWEILFPKEIR